jgi:protein-tyrosine phosphatase
MPTDACAPPADRLDGAPNFRSVAALPAAGGRRLRTLRLFRSDALHRLTDADLPRLAALRIGSVLDLRRDDERASAPSRWPAPAVPETLTFDVAPDLQAVRAGGWRDRLADPGFDAGEARRWMIDTYARMPAAFGPAVREAIGRLSAPAAAAPATLLVHCTAGKDRTGFVVAMVLAALEVPRDAIVDDYLESSRRRPPAALAQALAMMGGIEPTPRSLGAIETIAGVRTEFLDAALDAVARDFGSVPAYLRACGLDGQALDALRAAMLDRA